MSMSRSSASVSGVSALWQRLRRRDCPALPTHFVPTITGSETDSDALSEVTSQNLGVAGVVTGEDDAFPATRRRPRTIRQIRQGPANPVVRPWLLGSARQRSTKRGRMVKAQTALTHRGETDTWTQFRRTQALPSPRANRR
jgi:hypothetical protein